MKYGYTNVGKALLLLHDLLSTAGENLFENKALHDTLHPASRRTRRHLRQ